MVQPLSKRTYYFDALRIVAIGAIVLLHVAGSYWYKLPVSTLDWQVTNLYDCITRWGVPVFVMISGALFLDPAREQPIKKIWTKNIPKLVRLLIFWGFLYALVYNLPPSWSGEDIALFIHEMLFGTPHLWFLFMLLGLYVLIPIVRCITANETAMRYFLVVAFVMNFVAPISTGGGTIPAVQEFVDAFMIQLPLGYSFYFVLGYYLSSHNISRTVRYATYILAIITLGLATVISSGVSLAQGSASTFVIQHHYPFMFAAAAVFIAVKQHFIRQMKAPQDDLTPYLADNPHRSDKENERLEMLQELSSCTLGVYAIHIFVLRFLIGLGIDPIGFASIITMPLMALAVLAISFGIAYVLKRIPFLGKYFV